MKSKRRLLLVILSVTVGSLLSLWLMKRRMGTLRANDYFQLGFNFLFAAAVVIGISIFLQRMNDKEKKEQDKK